MDVALTLVHLGHPDDVRPLPMHLDDATPMSRATQVKSHLYSRLSLEGHIGAALRLSGVRVLN